MGIWIGIILSILATPVFLQAQTTTASMQLVGYPSYFYSISQTPEKVFTFYSGHTDSYARCSCSDDATATCNSTTPCNSCELMASIAVVDPTACNDREIHPNLQFTVVIQTTATTTNFTSNSKVVGFLGDQPVAVFSNDLNGLAPKPGQKISVTFLWKDICQAAGNADCRVSFNSSFRVGIDKENQSTTTLSESVSMTLSHRYVSGSKITDLGCATAITGEDGACFFTVYPGDGKVFVNVTNIDEIPEVVPNLTSTTPTANDVSKQKYAAVRILLYPTAADPTAADFDQIFPNSSSADLPLDLSTDTLVSTKVTGLENDQPYVFSMATVDQGGNVTYFLRPASLAVDPLSYDIQPANYGLTQAAKPQEVDGLLDNKQCFIATAAYGTDLDSRIDVLRKFRSEILLPNRFGKSVVKYYYKNSPPVALYVRQHDDLRSLIRLLLYPVILVAELILLVKAYWILAFSFLFLLALSLFLLRRMRKQRQDQWQL